MPIVIDPLSIVKLESRVETAENGRLQATHYAATTAENQVEALDYPAFRRLFDAILEHEDRNLVLVSRFGGEIIWEVVAQ
jgi:hypothetical protein